MTIASTPIERNQVPVDSIEGLTPEVPKGSGFRLVLVLGSWHYVASTPTERNKVDSTGICIEINFILIGLLNN